MEILDKSCYLSFKSYIVIIAEILLFKQEWNDFLQDYWSGFRMKASSNLLAIKSFKICMRVWVQNIIHFDIVEVC